MEVIEAGGAEGSKLVRQASTSSMMDDKVRYGTPPHVEVTDASLPGINAAPLCRCWCR